ncbi:hypothetical protein [Pseudomonas sp. NFX15]|uniref:hypothetical protein n=1 Tax=Pseudomonas sp. NFX15 TaxID=2816958 RepID=UPI003B8D58DE
MKSVLDKVALAYSLDVNPDDLDDHGNIKEYIPPVFDPFVGDMGGPDLIDLQPLLDGGPGPTALERETGITAGWCPNGSWGGGICRPFNNVRTSWMGTYGVVRNIPIHMAILPGTHNSGFDKTAASTPSMEVCQDVAPFHQLEAGIRVLDLRVQYYSGYSMGDPRRFSIFHSTNNGRTVKGDIIDGVLMFHYAPNWDAKREIVILNFHRFRNFTAVAHDELNDILKTSFGSAIISPLYRDLTVSQIWALPGQKNVVISYNTNPRDALFWEGVNQRWIGVNTPSDDQLKVFIDQVGNEVKPAGELRAIQAHRMSPWTFIPSDISGSLMSWFAAGNASYPIMKYFIINCDWSLRHRLVDNIIYSNQYRSRAMGIPDVVQASPGNAAIQGMPDARHMIVRIDDTHWAATLALPPILNDEPHRLLIVSDTDAECKLDLHGSDVPLPGVRLSKGEAVALVCLDSSRRWALQVRDCSPNEHGYVIAAPSDGEKFVRYTVSVGNYAPLVYLPDVAPANSVVLIVSKAPYATRISHPLPTSEIEHVIAPGQVLAFTFRVASGQWDMQEVLPDSQS